MAAAFAPSRTHGTRLAGYRRVLEHAEAAQRELGAALEALPAPPGPTYPPFTGGELFRPLPPLRGESSCFRHRLGRATERLEQAQKATDAAVERLQAVVRELEISEARP